MKWLSLVLALLVSGPAFANPTGAPLFSFPVEPCRILDTRASGPIQSGGSILVHVRGSALPPSQGATNADCGVPLSAEAVVINVAAIQPGSAGQLKINGWGYGYGPKGIYSRLNFSTGQIIANEIQVSLCNSAPFPSPHVPCAGNSMGLFGDFTVEAQMTAGTSVHVVADVVGYLARQ